MVMYGDNSPDPYQPNASMPGDPPANEEVPTGETPVIKKIGIPWKAILAFLAVLGGQLWARVMVAGVPVLPTDVKGFVALLGAAFVAAVGIYFKSNVYTVKQAEKNLDKANRRSGGA